MVGWLIAIYAFLYAPIVFLIALSFNDSRMVTSWAGFSTRWYVALWHDPALIEAALLSLRIAAVSATLATIVGTAAGYALARFGRFRGRGLFEAMLAAPLVLPEVMTGLSLLLLFVALEQTFGWPAGRGAGTVTIAHASVSVAYVTVVVRARLAEAGTALEDAPALDDFSADHPAADGTGAGIGVAAGVHPVDGRRGGRQLHLRPGGVDAADGGIFGHTAGRYARDLRVGDHHRRGGRAGAFGRAWGKFSAPALTDRGRSCVFRCVILEPGCSFAPRSLGSRAA